MILGYEMDELKKLNGHYTAQEIVQQPALWMQIYELIQKEKQHITDFLNANTDSETLILFTGAGSSDYIGDTIKSHVRNCMDVRVESVATTDIVANPQEVIERGVKTILVSFARSGNSPESIGAYRIMQENTEKIAHVIITCNKDGDLVKEAKENGNSFMLILPEETNDKGFAMTSSFSCMLLAALLFFDIKNLAENKKYVDMISRLGEQIIQNDWIKMRNLSGCDPVRVVYLGAGCLSGLAREMALKNMELTNGKIATMQETILGFRHGPKTFMNKDTDVIILMSHSEYTNRYIKDLLREIYHDSRKHKLTVISCEKDEEIEKISDECILAETGSIPDAYSALVYVLYGQMFAFFNSVRLGIEPDNPSPDGSVNRVVKGVVLHSYCDMPARECEVVV
ncbi:MAG: SIS domain-containing protein [Lachnospiraceae bacterium]|nr:SIS domain-containing protein [Lachnospiraceae bacterium]